MAKCALLLNNYSALYINKLPLSSTSILEMYESLLDCVHIDVCTVSVISITFIF